MLYTARLTDEALTALRKVIETAIPDTQPVITKKSLVEICRTLSIRITELETPDDSGNTYLIHRKVSIKDLVPDKPGRDYLVWYPITLDDPIDSLDYVLYAIIHCSRLSTILMEYSLDNLGLSVAELEKVE